MNKEKNAFILYEYDQFKDDYMQIMEYYTIKELMEKNKNIIQLENKKSIYQFITENIDDVKHLIKDRYCIIKERI